MIGLTKFRDRLRNRFYPYWCPFCTLRYRDKTKFADHYLAERKAYIEKRTKNKAVAKVRAERARVLKAKRKQGRR